MFSVGGIAPSRHSVGAQSAPEVKGVGEAGPQQREAFDGTPDQGDTDGGARHEGGSG